MFSFIFCSSFECCSIFVESSTSLLNTVGCYGYWWIDYVFFYFPFFCFVLCISEFGVVWVLLNRFCFLFFFFFFKVYLNSLLLWLLLNKFCFFLFLVSLNTMYFDLKCDSECNCVNVWCILTWIVMLNVIVLMSVVLMFQLSMFLRILDLLWILLHSSKKSTDQFKDN